MPKLYDLAERWSVSRYLDPDGLFRYRHVRPLHLVQRNFNQSSPDWNNDEAILAEAYACVYDASDPNTVDGSSVIGPTNTTREGMPHPFVNGARVTSFTNFVIVNQFEAMFDAVYETQYPTTSWGAAYSGMPSVTKQRSIEDATVPYLSTVPGGAKWAGPCKRTRSVIHFQLASTLTLPNYGAMASTWIDIVNDTDKINTPPLLGTDAKLGNMLYIGSQVIPDPQTASVAGGVGRYQVVDIYRWKAPMKEVLGATGHNAIPAVAVSGELSWGYDSNGNPMYINKTLADLYSVIT